VTDRVDVAIVGGGPAGAALAIRLSRLGYATAVLERRPYPEWHACGVFSSPRTRARLADLGFSRGQIARLNRPISGLALRTAGDATCRIEYEHGYACGFDRVRLDTALLDAARRAGADVRSGVVVRDINLAASHGDQTLVLSPVVGSQSGAAGPNPTELRARLVVGADGSSSAVARAAGAHRARGWFRRMGLTFHRADPSAAAEGAPMDGSFFFGRGWYVGVAPVPGARVNVGMVLPYSQARSQPLDFAERAIARVPTNEPWQTSPNTDSPQIVGRLQHHATRICGPGWLLVGDAIGFIDPLTGEGLQRAFVSAEIAADHVGRMLSGDASAAADYDRHIKSRFTGKNMVSWLLQLFLAQPATLDYALRRLDTRADLREQLTLVLTDQSRASTAVDPRFLARLLRP
jgi:flavin-dependent dehydrogenase